MLHYFTFFRSLFEKIEEEADEDEDDVQLNLSVPQTMVDKTKNLDFARLKTSSPGRNSIKWT